MTPKNVDYIDRLRRLAINDERLAEDDLGRLGRRRVDARSEVARARPPRRARRGRWRRAVLRAHGRRGGGAPARPPPRSWTCWSASPRRRSPGVVAAAPKVAMALGYDIDEALDGLAPRADRTLAAEQADRVACSTASLRDETPSLR